jgi:phosphoribosyl-AMP cyclohydrolase
MNVEKGNLKELKYNADGLIPAIIQDGQNGRVLMLAYMNAESTLKVYKSQWRKAGLATGHGADVSYGERGKPVDTSNGYL